MRPYQLTHPGSPKKLPQILHKAFNSKLSFTLLLFFLIVMLKLCMGVSLAPSQEDITPQTRREIEDETIESSTPTLPRHVEIYFHYAPTKTINRKQKNDQL